MSEKSEQLELIDGATCLLADMREEFRAEILRLHGPEGLVLWLRSSWDPADYLDPSLPPLAERGELVYSKSANMGTPSRGTSK